MAAIGILCSDPTGAVAHYRAGSLGSVLRARGHTVVVSDQGRTTPAGSVALMLAEGNDPEGRVAGWEPDALILTGGWVSGAPLEMLDEARAEGQRVILDIDDSLELPEHNYAYDPELKRAKLTACAHADAVIVSTPPLQRELRRARVRLPVAVSRNVVELERYRTVRELNDARASRYDIAGENPRPLVIGWRGSVPHHRGDVALLARAFGVIYDALGLLLDTVDVRFVHLGAHPDAPHAFARAVGLPEQRVEARPWVPFGAYPAILTGVDIAVVPLDGSAFTRAKSNIAGLEWAAAGVPFVASWNEAYDAFCGGIPGTLARTPDELGAAIVHLLEPAHRGAVRATQRFTLEAIIPNDDDRPRTSLRGWNWTADAAAALDEHPVEELLERLAVPDARGRAAGISPAAHKSNGGATPSNPQDSPQVGDACK